MAEVKNAFIKSKMNKDLDSRLIPSGEYRDAQNAQISRSEGDDVGALENVLGNEVAGKDAINLGAEFEAGESYADDLTCIGYFSDESTNCIYVFLTDGVSQDLTYDKDAHNFIYKYQVGSPAPVKLVEGAFLNFSKYYPIHGVNLLEGLLFFTDNRNQPRKINVNLANPESLPTPTYYTNEDQISVAKYNPYEPIQLFEEITAARVADNSLLTAAEGEYDTTMRDVVSKFYPDGGTAQVTATATGTVFSITDPVLEFFPKEQGTGLSNNEPQAGMTLGKILASNPSGPIEDTGVLVDSYSTNQLTVSGSITLALNDILVFNFNPYYDNAYAGDSRFLEDKFVRFSYRFKFDDGEYSIYAPFTQPCFIPKQDGYFLNNSEFLGDQQSTFGSTIVSFMENKVNEIKLIIPLPSTGTNLRDEFKITEVDILFKESDGLAVQVAETITVSDVATSAGSNDYYEYTYINKKPYKTLPESGLIRVYDKIPVRALSQEIISNRVVYGNFQDKHTPPASLDYYVAVGDKEPFNDNILTAKVDGAAGPTTDFNLKDIDPTTSVPYKGAIVSGLSVVSPCFVDSYTGTTVTFTTNQTLPNDEVLTFTPPNDIVNYTSEIEYPSSSVKTNRTYQVGVVLSDKFGRQSSVILSNNKDVITVNDISYSGETIYSAYPSESNLENDIQEWPGNSLKVSFNAIIDSLKTSDNVTIPGMYNGDPNDDGYNPLGWYSFKIVVKQQEQEYYNVYTAGAIKGLPFGGSSADFNTSFVTLINDNINKVPRDLEAVGPQDKTFRSSVRLFGRVMNTEAPFSNTGNEQYPIDPAQPGSILAFRSSFTTNTIEDLFDLFDVADYSGSPGNDPITSPKNPYYPFFKSDSNPFVGEIITSQIASEQFGVENIPNGQNNYTKVENLAIFETAPVVSRLELFYETSTSGLISDLNVAINNSEGVFTAFIDRFLDNSFQEDLKENESMLAGNFEIVDALGIEYDLANFTVDVTMPLVVNGNGLKVVDPLDVSVDPYFELFENLPTNPGEYNIRVKLPFTDNVYVGSNFNEYNFTFTFEVTVTEISTGNSTTSTINKQSTLVNLDPELFNNGATPPEPPNATKTLDPQEANIPNLFLETLYAKNSAYTKTTYTGPNTYKDLTYQIVSATNSSLQSVIEKFTLTNQVENTTTGFNTIDLETNNAYGPTGQSQFVTPDTYEILVQVADGGSSIATIEYTVLFGTVPVSFQTVDVEDSSGGTIGGLFDIPLILVNDQTDVNKNGYYLYKDQGGWNNTGFGTPLETTVSSGVIDLDFTNSANNIGGTVTCNNVPPNNTPATWIKAGTISGLISLLNTCSQLSATVSNLQVTGTFPGSSYKWNIV